MTRPRKTNARRPHKHRKERANPSEGRAGKAGDPERGEGRGRRSHENLIVRGGGADHEDVPSTSEPVVVLTRAGVQRLGGGHPWLFEDHIAVNSSRDGELIRLEGPPGVERGAACLSVGSRIPLRVVSREPGFLPAGEASDEVEWAITRLEAALARREQCVPEGDNSYRMVHSEADGLPGLVIDRFAEVAVFQAGCRWADAAAPAMARYLVEQHGFKGALARNDGGFRKLEDLPEGVSLLAGEVPEHVIWKQGGIRREVDPWRGQKTGTYLDQRENQPWAAEVLPVGRCLDAFSHDGGFALHLAAAGSQVQALDSSQPALERLARHAQANELSDAIETHQVNVFEDLRERVGAGEQFDGIVLDPPALAKRKPDLQRALRAYKELNLRALRLLRPGGRLLTCSCSFHLSREDFLGSLRAAAADARRDVTVLATRGAARCHPHLLTYPESDYLKAVLLEVR